MLRPRLGRRRVARRARSRWRDARSTRRRPKPCARCKLAQVSLGQAGAAAVFAGEVKPRHESELGFRIGGKIVARLRRRRRAREEGRAARAARPRRRRAAGAGGEGRGRRGADRVRVREGGVRALREPVPAEVRQRERARPEAQRDERQRAKLEQARAQLAVARNQAGYATLVADQDGVVTAVTAEVGQVVTAGQPVVRVARDEEREVAISVPENRLDELKGGAAARRRAVGESGPGLSGEGARDRAGGRRGDAHVRRARVDPRARSRGAVGHDRQRRAAGPTPIRAAALVPSSAIYHADDGKPAVWIYDPATRTVSLRPVTLGRVPRGRRAGRRRAHGRRVDRRRRRAQAARRADGEALGE